MDNNADKIAVIGISGRFPGANSPHELWRNLCGQKETLQNFSLSDLLKSGEDAALIKQGNYVPVRGIVENVKEMDADFFGFSAQEAKILDPQQRVFIECAWECFEDAGCVPDAYDGRVGVFASCGISYYLINNILPNTEFLANADYYQILLGNDKDFLATRIAYKFNLRGPALTIACGCSSSLVAVHYACQSLLSGECEMALAGGVSISIPQEQGYLYKKDMIGSPDGHCYAFDARAQGTVKSNGSGAVLLKLLNKAIQDKDHVYAIIRGSAVNNDGSGKVGYTAPSVDQQAAVITKAMAASGINANTVQYVEAHGTGTILGDPIEIAALTKAYATDNVLPQSCAISSIKTNLGHLDVAAGVTGMIKLCLSLKHKQMIASLNYQVPNPRINFSNSPFYVNTQTNLWEKLPGQPRRGAVSSFGVGGTNVHMIIDECNDVEKTEKSAENLPRLILFSAKQVSALEAYKDKLYQFIADNHAINFTDIAYTLHAGRKQFSVRNFFVGKSKKELLAFLQTNTTGVNKISEKPVKLVFMFSGQGSQYANMGLGLYQAIPYFRDILDECLNILYVNCSLELKPILFSNQLYANEILTNTKYTQPALFVVEYALAKLLMHWGIQPTALIGHSLGEYVAAAISGVVSLTDALVIVAKRGELLQELPRGSMLSAACSEEVIKQYINQDIAKVSIALINSHKSIVLSGDTNGIQTMQKLLTASNIPNQILATSHAFHSYMLDDILETFADFIKTFSFNAPKIPMISNVTGTWLTVGALANKNYWIDQLRKTVLFSAGIECLNTKVRPAVFIEIGPGRALETLVKQHGIQNAINTMHHTFVQSSDETYLYQSLGKLWLQGATINVDNFYSGQECQRISLPTYVWQRNRYWIDDSSRFIKAKQSSEVIVVDSQEEFDINLLEGKLRMAWYNALGVENKDLEENFFEAGGDSLAAVNFIDQLDNYLKDKISITTIFNCPTLTKLIKYIQQKDQRNLALWATDSADSEIAIFQEQREL